jgi:hypothetical protein
MQLSESLESDRSWRAIGRGGHTINLGSESRYLEGSYTCLVLFNRSEGDPPLYHHADVGPILSCTRGREGEGVWVRVGVCVCVRARQRGRERRQREGDLGERKAG